MSAPTITRAELQNVTMTLSRAEAVKVSRAMIETVSVTQSGLINVVMNS